MDLVYIGKLGFCGPGLYREVRGSVDTLQHCVKYVFSITLGDFVDT